MNILKSVLILCILCLSFSCSSDDDDNNTTTAMSEEGQLVATVDNANFISGDTDTGGLIVSGTLQLTAENDNGDKVALYISDFENEGTFDLSGFTAEATALYIPSGANQFFSSLNEGGSGTLTITEYNETDATVSGTFNFIAVRQSTNNSGETSSETVEVTNGSFTAIELN